MTRESTYLRCALVYEKTILDERVFGPTSRVTVGDSPRATFTLQGPSLGKSHLLFQHSNNGTVLHLKEGMLGRVKIGGQTREAEQLAAGDATGDHNGSVVRYTLTEGDQGVLVFGRVGLMFDVIRKAEKPPPSTIRNIIGADPFTGKVFGIVLALLVLFSLVSRIFAVGQQPFTVEQLPERMVSFVVEDPEAAKEFQKELDRMREEKKKKLEEQKQESAKEEIKKEESRTAKRTSNDSPDDVETAKIRKKVANKGMVGALSAARKKGGALDDVLGKGGLGISLNSAVAALDRGAARARVLTSSGSGGMLVPTLTSRRGTSEALGEGVVESAGTGRVGREASRRSRLAERTERQVTVSMPSSNAQVTGGTLSKKQIFDVVTRNRGAIKYCYESQLMRYPTLRGKIVVDFIIDVDGRVSKVRVPDNSLSQAGAMDKVSRCLVKFISRWRFPKPRGGKVRVIYPFTFGRSK